MSRDQVRAGLSLAGSATQVRFAILDLLKGHVSSTTIEFNGSLTDRDDYNDRSVPYVSSGPEVVGVTALRWRTGLALNTCCCCGATSPQARPNELTPYWAPLSPTNEQLFDGVSDAWFIWVSKELGRRSTSKKDHHADPTHSTLRPRL